MSNESPDLAFRHPVIAGLSRRRTVYAAAVISMALLVFVLLSLSFSVKGFRTVQAIQVQPGVWGSIALNDVRVLVIDAVKQSTDEPSLIALLDQWQTNSNSKPGEVTVDAAKVDLEKLRAKLSFAITADARDGNLVLHLGYTGRGAETERAFLKLFAKSVFDRLAQQGELTSAQLAALRFDPSVIEHGRAIHSQLIARSAEQVNLLKEQLEDVTSLVNSEIAQSKAKSENDPSAITPRAAQLQRQMVALSHKRDDLASELSVSHPDVITVRQEIERIQAELDQALRVQPKVLKNSFIQASFSGNKDVGSLHPVRESVEHISVDGLDGVLHSLDSNWQETLNSVESMAQGMDAALASKPLLRVEEKELVQSAVGTSIGQRSLIIALLASVLVGCTIAVRLNVWSFDQGFVSREDASSMLDVPVFSSVTGESQRPVKLRSSFSAKILKLSEIVLFTTLLVVAGMFVIDHEFRDVVMSNPFQALSRLIWMLRT